MSNLNNLPDTAGVLICGHGSRASIAEKEFSLLAKSLRDRYPHLKVAYGFLEYSAPNIHMALDSLLAQGVKKIYAVPAMLFAATHAQNDIPSVLTSYEKKQPDLEIYYGQELGLHNEMIQAFQARIIEALALPEIPAVGELYETMLVVVGRGTSVVEANAEAAKLTRIVSENMGFGWSETVYSGVTFPAVGRGLEIAAKTGFKKIVVAPYFLFGGRLIDRIYHYVDKVANDLSDIEFKKADYLRDQAHVINALVDRIEAIVTPTTPVAGLMQNFKQRLARGEIHVHHHHAEYQQPQAAHEHPANSHQHFTHKHAHAHYHAPYKHIGHPHGPRTMINENVCCCFMSQFPQHIIDEEKAIKTVLPGTPACNASGKKA